MLLIFRISLIGRMGRNGPVPPLLGKLSCSWLPVWLAPFEMGQIDGRSLVLVCETPPGKMSSL